jgi:hypothetical protein
MKRYLMELQQTTVVSSAAGVFYLSHWLINPSHMNIFPVISGCIEQAYNCELFSVVSELTDSLVCFFLITAYR